MRIKLDENLPGELVGLLAGLGHDVDTAAMEGLTGEPDTEVAAAAARERRMVVTQDVVFADRRRWLVTPGGGVMLVRIASDRRADIIARLFEVFATGDTDGWPSKHVVVSDHKVRVNPLGGGR
jgi:predicted nuclease of predicted toxin-antitoxin system